MQDGASGQRRPLLSNLQQPKNQPRPYHGEVDVFGVYSPDTGSAYLIPLAGLGDNACSLRLGPTANNQVKGVRFAADYEIGQAAPPRRLKLV